MDERIIGRFGGVKEGPLLICVGGIHGNEPAGVAAIEEILRLLEEEAVRKPGFIYRGSFLGVKGNLGALQSQTRFVESDLNRMLSADMINAAERIPEEELSAEKRELLEFTTLLEGEIRKNGSHSTLVVDLHTTTADGGVFTISKNDAESRRLAKGLHVPVILGIAEDLKGTTIEYFHRPHEQCHCIVFEAGSHQDPECIHRCVSAIVNCMRSIGAIDASDVDHRHDQLLSHLSNGHPKVAKLIYHYRIQSGEFFSMNPGYKNFQQVKRGEELAKNEMGPIYAPLDGMILMPKYQPLGDDGFFIVEPLE
jgi:succinylglutamate desuccinylase